MKILQNQVPKEYQNTQAKLVNQNLKLNIIKRCETIVGVQQAIQRLQPRHT